MIKPQSQPSYFVLEAKEKDRNRSGHIPAKSQHPFNSNLQTPGMPALPTGQSNFIIIDKQGYTD